MDNEHVRGIKTRGARATNIQNFLKNNWQNKAILSWSVNAIPVAERWEKLAPSVVERLKAAKRVHDFGYEVRLRIDPIVPVDDWQKHYAQLVDMIYDRFEPERVTLGCLRGLNSTIVLSRDKSWVAYLAEEGNWGKKPPFKQRLEMYRLLTGKLAKKGLTELGICKDTLAVWRALKMNRIKIRCNCVW